MNLAIKSHMWKFLVHISTLYSLPFDNPSTRPILAWISLNSLPERGPDFKGHWSSPKCSSAGLLLLSYIRITTDFKAIILATWYLIWTNWIAFSVAIFFLKSALNIATSYIIKILERKKLQLLFKLDFNF